MAAPQYHSTTSLVPRNIRDFDDLHAIRNALTSRWGDFDFQDLSITWPDRSLIALESELTWKNAKHNISRQCHHKDCLKKAPGSYPKNVYLCDAHKITLSEKLQECVIDCDKGSENEKRMCKELKRDYQQLCDAIKIPDNQQAFDKRNRYPRNYFSVAMAQLLYCRQTISRVNTTSFDAKSKQTTEQLQKTVETIMELLIVARQTLNDFWVAFFEFLIKIIQQLGITMDHFTGSPAAFNHWITSHSCYVFGLYSAIVALFAAFGYLIIFGESGTGMKKIGACGAIGMAVGGMLGGPAGALAGGLLGGGIGTLVFL
eukprot:1053899_1